jgi:hypothetical protein
MSTHAVIDSINQKPPRSAIRTGELVVNLDTRTVSVDDRVVHPDRKGVRRPGAAQPAQGHGRNERDVFQISLWWNGRAGDQNHRCFCVQTAQETS